MVQRSPASICGLAPKEASTASRHDSTRTNLGLSQYDSDLVGLCTSQLVYFTLYLEICYDNDAMSRTSS